MLQYLSAQKENEREEKREKHCSHNYTSDYFKDFFKSTLSRNKLVLNYGVTLYVKNTFDFFFYSFCHVFKMQKNKRNWYKNLAV